MSPAWAWAALAGLGAFHGLNPAMGWLFAVALGLQRQSRVAVLWSLLPIGLGHALSVAFVVALLALLRTWLDLRWLSLLAALILIGFGIYRLAAGHRGRGGMQVGAVDLTLWSFLMATGHGAGLMLVPVLLRLPIGPDGSGHAGHSAGLGQSASTALAAVVVHTAAMLGVAACVGVLVYDWFGLGFLRRGWINLDLLWALALVAAGVILLVGAAR